MGLWIGKCLLNFYNRLGGVFYREFTKLNDIINLTVVHTHYLLFYHIGLNLTVVMLAIRGVVQVLS